jgi:hypothetical protein
MRASPSARLAVRFVMLAGAATLTTPRAARAQGTAVDVTSTTSLNWHTDNDDENRYNDDYGEGLERLNASFTHGEWVGGARLDLSTFLSVPTGTGGMAAAALADRYETQGTPEKAWLGWTSRALEVRAGDSYVSFGRGLALSLRKVDELGVDTTVRGVKALYHAGNLFATLLAGYANINNVDEASGRNEDDPYDLIGGAQGGIRIADRVSVGGHGAVVLFRQLMGFAPPGTELDHYEDRWLMFGPTIDAPSVTEHLGFYLEGIGQRRQDGAKDETTSGYGLYASATYHRGRATLLCEGKAYGNLEIVQPKLEHLEFAPVRYNNPPTIERILQYLDHPQEDTVGGRTRFDWSLTADLRAFANYGLIRDYVGYATEMAGETAPATVHDPYGGIEARWDQARSRAQLVAGWRVAVQDGSGDVVRGDQHVEIIGAHALGERLSLELHGINLERKNYHPPFIDEEYREGTWQLGARYSPTLALAGIYDYTTQPLQPKRDYFGGAAEWRPTTWAMLRVFAGSSRGGLKCVSGVCRVFPPFEGIKLSVTIRY